MRYMNDSKKDPHLNQLFFLLFQLALQHKFCLYDGLNDGG